MATHHLKKPIISVDPERIRSLSEKAVDAMKGATAHDHILVAANIIMTYCECSGAAGLLIEIGKEISATGHRMAKAAN